MVSSPGVIAVTGLHGFTAARLVSRLLARSAGVRVIGLDLRRPMRFDDGARFHKLDLCDPTADGRLAEILEAERVEALVHTAFRADPTSDLELDHELETIGSRHVMNACAAAKVKRLVVASSTELYGPWPDNPNFLTEFHPLRGHPHAHAVRDRIEMETLLSAWSSRHPDIEVTVLRPCWIFGPEYWNRVVRYFSLPVVPVPLGYDPLFQLVHEEGRGARLRAGRAPAAARRLQPGGERRGAALDAAAAVGQARAQGSGPAAPPAGVLSLPGPDRRSARGVLRLPPPPLGRRRLARVGRVRGAHVLDEGSLDLLRLIASHAALPVMR
jgi:hypothetical protein